MSKEYTYKHINIICPECKGDNILIDDFHQETYCTQCGLVLKDTSITSYVTIIEYETFKEHHIRSLWKKDKKTHKKGEVK